MKAERNYQPIMVILVLIIIGIFLWILLKDCTPPASKPHASRRARNGNSGPRSDQKNHDLEEELKATRGETPPTEKMVEVFGPPAGEPAAKEKP